MNISRVRRRVEAIYRRFPAEQGSFSRPMLDQYGQPTGEKAPLGTVNCWRVPGDRPEDWKVQDAGQLHEDDGAVWITLVWKSDLPPIRHGDIVMLPDGVTRYIRNIQNRGDVRLFIQLSEG